MVGAQAGTEDFSASSGFINFNLSTSAEPAGGGTSTFAVYAGNYGGYYNLTNGGGNNYDYWQNQLITNGSNSLINYYGSSVHGNNSINLSQSQISSNLYLSGGSTSMQFSGYQDTVSSITGNVSNAELAGDGVGIAHVFLSDAQGLSTIENCRIGHDYLDMTLDITEVSQKTVSLGNSTAQSFITSSGTGFVITDSNSATQASDFLGHVSTGTVNSVQHLYIH